MDTTSSTEEISTDEIAKSKDLSIFKRLDL